jgi:dTMP kinase
LTLLLQICDRYAYSGVAFSSAKGLSVDWCMNCDVGLPAPDCVIYFDMPVEKASQV